MDENVRAGMNVGKVIKWIWIMNGVLAVLALLYWAASVWAFTDTVSCAVQGHVYKSTVEEVITFARADSCQGVRVSSDETKLVLYSPHAWVVVPISVEQGHRRFQYRWGAEVAHLEAGTVPVQWGWVRRGG